MRRALAGSMLLLIVAASLAAPLYARFVSRTDPFRSTPLATVGVLPVLAENSGLGVTPIGPGWRRAYLLGSDALGRDLAARLLYGGRTSLVIAGAATVLCLLLGTAVGVVAGYRGGAVDATLSAVIDLVWAFPVMLLAISLSVVLVSEGVRIGPVVIGADSLLLPVLILGLVYVPYVARPVRARAANLRRGPMVEAAVAVGGSGAHILRRHVMPQLVPLLAGLAPVVAATMLLTEAALSVVGIGVQPPAASWGTLIAEGQGLIYSRPIASIAPGLMVVATVLSLHLLADRDDG